LSNIEGMAFARLNACASAHFWTMNEGQEQPEQSAGASTPGDESSQKRLVNPNLSGTLTADHAALQNDLVQAQELAADFQRQLAGKSNEYAQLKQILAKTEKDLAHLNEGIVELRAERHHLANEAMRATAFQAKLAKVTTERDRLRIDLEIVRQAMAKKGDEMMHQLRDRDRHIAELVVEMVGLRQALEKATGECPPAPEPRIIPLDIPTPAPELEEDGEVEVEIFRTAAPK
jgi:hypothetical protein